MNGKRIVAVIAGALVAGVILGTAVSGFAASSKSTSPATSSVATACAGAGLRLGAAMRDGGARLLDVVAKLTGKSTADVVAERQAGKTFTQIAAESNVSSAAVVDATLAARAKLLADKVAAGDITQAQADTALANMKARLTTQVDSANTACTGAGGGAGRGQGACGGGGCGGGQAACGGAGGGACGGGGCGSAQ